MLVILDNLVFIQLLCARQCGLYMFSHSYTRECRRARVCVCVYGPPTTVGALTLTAGSKR